MALLAGLCASSAAAAELDAGPGFAAPSKRSQIPAPPPRRAGMTAEDGPALVAAWMKALDSLESGRDLAAWMRKHPAPVRVDQRLRGMGMYENGTIFIHEGMLTGLLEDVEKLGFREGAAVDALAWATVPVFAHEVEHAATRRRLAAETGAPYEHPDRDDELFSLAREIRVLREIARRFPDRVYKVGSIDHEQSAAHMRALGPNQFAEVERLAAWTFSSLPCLRLADPAKQKAESAEVAAYWKAQKAEKLKKAAGAGAPVLADLYKKEAEEDGKGESRAREVLAVASDPARFAVLKAHFQRRRDDLAAQWTRLP